MQFRARQLPDDHLGAARARQARGGHSDVRAAVATPTRRHGAHQRPMTPADIAATPERTARSGTDELALAVARLELLTRRTNAMRQQLAPTTAEKLMRSPDGNTATSRALKEAQRQLDAEADRVRALMAAGPRHAATTPTQGRATPRTGGAQRAARPSHPPNIVKGNAGATRQTGSPQPPRVLAASGTFVVDCPAAGTLSQRVAAEPSPLIEINLSAQCTPRAGAEEPFPGPVRVYAVPPPPATALAEVQAEARPPSVAGPSELDLLEGVSAYRKELHCVLGRLYAVDLRAEVPEGERAIAAELRQMILRELTAAEDLIGGVAAAQLPSPAAASAMPQDVPIVAVLAAACGDKEQSWLEGAHAYILDLESLRRRLARSAGDTRDPAVLAAATEAEEHLEAEVDRMEEMISDMLRQ